MFDATWAPIGFCLNGKTVEIATSPATRLTTVLRDHLGLFGTKVGCNAGDCGACTVLLDQEPVCACLLPLSQIEGRHIITIEGLPDALPIARQLQTAFLRYGAVQCGFCTAGMLDCRNRAPDRRHKP